MLRKIGFVQPGVSRSGIGGCKGVRVNLIISKESDGSPVYGFEARRVSLLFVPTASNGGEAMRRQGEQFVEKGGFSIVTAVVVGDRHQVKTGGKQAIIGAGVAAKDIRLGNRLTQPGDDTLQVA